MSVESVFKSFCSFGASKDGKALMDNAKFAKLFRDLDLLDKNLTATDVDIIFNRKEVKPKTERKINFDQFQVALRLVADKKYPGNANGLKKLEAKIISGRGPESSGPSASVKTEAGSVVDRLTDTSKYTGSHKERFDESGKGKGLARYGDRVADGYVSGYKNAGTYDK